LQLLQLLLLQRLATTISFNASISACQAAPWKFGAASDVMCWCYGEYIATSCNIYIYTYIYIVDITVEVNHILVVVICSKQQMLKGLLSFASENRTPNYIMMVVLLMAVRHLNYDNM
jgi:hypothetical protein